jgi:[mycofactocin precursor peptide]-tyrosine decarboxylase / 3-amino-5-[(4-hydroxyphenyl)methyl]-4,4-dimethylpyrrolidin-2-one synthase
MLTHLAAPTEVGFELLPYCNLRCAHCFANAGPDQPRIGLSLRKIEALYDELVDLQVFKIYLGGGEPFARRDIFDIIQFAAMRSLAVTISTNGTFLTERRIEAFRLVPSAMIQVSLDGACARTHDGIRGIGSFNKAVRALQLLVRAGLRPSIGTVACQSNYREIPDMLRLTLDLGVTSFHLMGLQPAGRALSQFEEQKLTEEQWLVLHKFFSRRAAELSKRIEFHIEIDKFVLFKNRLLTPQEHLDSFAKMWCTCPCGRSRCTIAANGDVLPCELMRDVVAGNVHRQSLRDIWKHSAGFAAIRRRSRGIAACSDCYFWDCCQGGCAAVTHNLTGKFTGADPRCELAR